MIWHGMVLVWCSVAWRVEMIRDIAMNYIDLELAIDPTPPGGILYTMTF